MVQRRAAAAVLAIIGVGSRLNKFYRNMETPARLVGRFAVAGGDFVQAAIEEPLRAACATEREKYGERCAGDG